ncbi:MAG: TPM domain-containing protein [Ruminococcaceae bacterium]|nr:TPM domain-containing protein [Oscillospiraceae bacterium]
MKKRALTLLLTIVLFLSFGVAAYATDEAVPKLDDGADLLSQEEERALLEKLSDITSRNEGVQVIVVTTDTLEGKSPMEYADDYYDNHCFGASGVLLLVSTEDNDWWISTSGFGITAFTDAGIAYISDRFVPYLSDGDYAEAFDIYADLCDEFIAQARTGEPYDTWNLPKAPFGFLKSGLIAVLIGVVVAFIAMSGMKAKLHSARQQAGASAYVKNDSLHITEARDMYLYSTVRRVRRENEGGSSTHRSSSGRSHGGGGGKF